MILRRSSKLAVLRHGIVGRTVLPTSLIRHPTRILTCSAIYRQKNEPRNGINSQSPLVVGPIESIKPESVQKNRSANVNQAPKTDALLTEQAVSNKEQRKADWAILKEMSRYLWPKVCSLSTEIYTMLMTTKDDLGTKARVSTALALLVGSKVASTWPKMCLLLLKTETDSQCSSPFLFQKHC